MWRGLSVTDSFLRKGKGKGDKEGNGEGRAREGEVGGKRERKERKKREEKRRGELYIYVPLNKIPLSRNHLGSGVYCFLSPMYFISNQLPY